MSGNFILGQGKLKLYNTDLIPSKARIRRNISGQMSTKDCCNQRLEADTTPEILHFFGQGNLTFIRKKSGNFEN